MTTQSSSNEAVEAVRKWVAETPWKLPHETCIRSFTQVGYWALPEEKLEAATRILAAEVERLRANEDEGCEWRGDCDYWAWETKCGSTFTFESGGPKENGIAFCPGCGRKVKIQTNDK